MTPDREAEHQARRLAAKVDDCRDRPEQTAREFIEIEDHAAWLKSQILHAKIKSQGAES